MAKILKAVNEITGGKIMVYRLSNNKIYVIIEDLLKKFKANPIIISIYNKYMYELFSRYKNSPDNSFSKYNSFSNFFTKFPIVEAVILDEKSSRYGKTYEMIDVFMIDVYESNENFFKKIPSENPGYGIKHIGNLLISNMN